MFNLKLVSLCIGLLIASDAANAGGVVIVNKDNQAVLSEKDISRIFLGNLKSYSTGDTITPINITSKKALRKEFNKKVLHKSSSQVKAYWSKLLFSGKGVPPKELKSDQQIKEFIAANPNAIGYIDRKNLDDSVKSILEFL